MSNWTGNLKGLYHEGESASDDLQQLFLPLSICGCEPASIGPQSRLRRQKRQRDFSANNNNNYERGRRREEIRIVPHVCRGSRWECLRRAEPRFHPRHINDAGGRACVWASLAASAPLGFLTRGCNPKTRCRSPVAPSLAALPHLSGE